MIHTYICRETKLEDLLRFKCEPSQLYIYNTIINNIEYTKFMLDNSFVIEDTSNNELIALVDSNKLSHYLAAVGVLFSTYFVNKVGPELKEALKIIRRIVDSIQKTYNCSLITSINEDIQMHIKFAKLVGFEKSNIDSVSELCLNNKIYYRNYKECH